MSLIKKNLDYYMNLSYKVEVKALDPEDGGGFMATIPLLGRYAVVGDGETEEEALADLELCKRDNFEDYIKAKIEIPEP